jgi:integrase
MRTSDDDANTKTNQAPCEEVPRTKRARKLQRFPRKTRFPGIEEVSDRTYRIRTRVVDPRTGKMKEIDRVRECTERKALLLQAEWREQMMQETGEPAQRVRLRDFATSWLRGKLNVLLPPTIDKYTRALDDHLHVSVGDQPALGDFYLDALRHDDIVTWRDAKKAKGYRALTVNGWLRLIKTLMADATALHRLPVDPAARVEMLPVDDTRITADDPNCLSAEEMGRFLAAMKERCPQHYALTFALFSTGARLSQVTALKWEDIDFEAGTIRFRRRRWNHEVYSGVKGPQASSRTRIHEVALVDELAEVLQEHRQRLLAIQHQGLGERWVFPSDTGAPHHNTILRKPFLDVLAHLNIRRRFTPHGLRRTVNNLTRKVAGSVVAKAVIGHATEAMHEHYSHVDLAEKRQAMKKVVELVQSRGRGGSGGGSAE